MKIYTLRKPYPINQNAFPFVLFLLLSTIVGLGKMQAQPQGAINGLFSVSDTQKVYFSQGNLQYIDSVNTPYWKFAENQWDVLGTTTGQNSTNQNVDRILNLFDQIGIADWGYNAINNGEGQTNQWRTLTQEEWAYVLNTRCTTSGIRYAKALVNGVNGVILLPDDWDTSTYSLSNPNGSSGANYTNNVINSTQWSILENAGAVFLPAAGERNEASTSLVGSFGYYWSASFYDTGYAWRMYFTSNSLSSNSCGPRYNGQSVRLVRSSL